MRRAVDGRFKVVFLETTLPLLKVVTVTFGATVLTALVAFAVCEVLRVRLLRGVVGFAADDLTDIKRNSFVYLLIISIKKPPWGFCVTLS